MCARHCALFINRVYMNLCLQWHLERHWLCWNNICSKIQYLTWNDYMTNIVTNSLPELSITSYISYDMHVQWVYACSLKTRLTMHSMTYSTVHVSCNLSIWSPILCYLTVLHITLYIHLIPTWEGWSLTISPIQLQAQDQQRCSEQNPRPSDRGAGYVYFTQRREEGGTHWGVK